MLAGLLNINFFFESVKLFRFDLYYAMHLKKTGTID